ncbi:hypothetical protein SK355_10935 [Candidatus Fukatsuia symbiotica]|nr:hypothetical protein [Candidatus Fukatsuia symbiotica]MEA9445704.1 hypothetical protein [Candidatus Fukatsuia symbiotica]
MGISSVSVCIEEKDSVQEIILSSGERQSFSMQKQEDEFNAKMWRAWSW